MWVWLVIFCYKQFIMSKYLIPFAYIIKSVKFSSFAHLRVRR